MKNVMEIQHATEYKAIGLNGAYYRKMKGLTQLQLAELADISRTHISNIEAIGMKTSVSLEVLFQIASALDIPVYKLFICPGDE